jgi:co-chaperonin GroES (HSP10)
MRVLKDKVLVTPTAAPTMKGTLYIVSPGNTEQIIDGTIIGMGSDVTGVNIGDCVFFNKFSATKITYDGKDYYALSEKEIAVVL